MVKSFEKDTPKLLEPPHRDLIINCVNCASLTQQWIRALMMLHKSLKGVNKQLRLISVNPKLESYLIEQGVISSLKISPSLRAALSEFGLISAKQLDVNFINPFLDGAMKVLKIQAKTEAKPGAPFKKDANASFGGDISGVIGLVSDSFTGSVVISFPEKTFLAIMTRMLGEECHSITREIQDGAGELTNIIFGQAKVVLNEKGYGIKTAIPSVVSGKDHSVQTVSSGPRVVVPFSSDAGDFMIEICLSD
jgi:chemotaxis protein CheX